MKEHRITEQAVINAYRATGLLPARLTFADRRKEGLCGCPIAALYLAEHPNDLGCRSNTIGSRAAAWANKRFGGDYVLPFTVGFDEPTARECRYGTDRGVQGYGDGQAVAAAVKREFAEVMSL